MQRQHRNQSEFISILHFNQILNIIAIVSAAPEAPQAVYGTPIQIGYAPSTVQCEFLETWNFI